MTETTKSRVEDRVAAETVLGLTSHELAYLLELAPGVASDRSKSFLTLPSPEDRASFLAAGASSLIVRQLATVEDGDVIVPSDIAALVGSVLTEDAVWIELALISDPSTEAAFLVFGPSAALVIGPRALGTFEVRFVGGDRTPGALTAAVIMSFLGVQLPSAAYARLIHGGADIALALRHLKDDILEFSLNEGDDIVSATWSTGQDSIRELIVSSLDGGVASGA